MAELYLEEVVVLEEVLVQAAYEEHSAAGVI